MQTTGEARHKMYSPLPKCNEWWPRAVNMIQFVGWLLNVSATCEYISGTDLLNLTCCYTDIEVTDPTFHLTQSQYTDTGPTSPRTDPITPGAGRVATGVPIFKSLVWLDPGKIPEQSGIRTRESSTLEADALTTRPTRRPSGSSHWESWTMTKTPVCTDGSSDVDVRNCLRGCCSLVTLRPSNMLVHLRDRSAQTIVRAATLR